MMNKITPFTKIAAVSICVLFVGYFITLNNVYANSVIKVYKSATCGCCNKWINYMQKNGFDIKSVNTNDMDTVKQHYRIPKSVKSCHTAIVNGYVLEGHVPANTAKKIIRITSSKTFLVTLVLMKYLHITFIIKSDDSITI